MHILETIYAIPEPSSRYLLPSNHKDILIVIPETEDPSQAATIFIKMMDKLQRSYDDECHMINLGKENRVRYTTLLQDFGFKILILCGISPLSVGLQSSLMLHYPVHLDSICILRTDEPSILEKSELEHRKAFWLAFQATFEK